MVDLTRRFFLGGAVSAIVLAHSVPRSLAGNTPVIWGDGIKDDAGGFAALLRNEPVIFTKDKISIDRYGEPVIHKGSFCINHPIEVPEFCDFKIESAKFIAGQDLALEDPYFRAHRKHMPQFTGIQIGWVQRREYGASAAPVTVKRKVHFIDELDMRDLSEEGWDLNRAGPYSIAL